MTLNEALEAAGISAADRKKITFSYSTEKDLTYCKLRSEDGEGLSFFAGIHGRVNKKDFINAEYSADEEREACFWGEESLF